MSSNNNDNGLDGELRMNRLNSSSDKKVFPQILDLIVNFPIDNESYHNILSFFRKNSLNSFPECEQVLSILNDFISSTDLSRCCHGIRCIYYVLCQKTFQFQTDFAYNLCNSLSRFINCPDQTIFYNLLRILFFISTISSEYEQTIKQIIPINVLNDILISSTNQKVILSAINLFKMYLKTERSSCIVYTSLCEVSHALIEHNQSNINVINEAVKLCLFFAQKNECWITIYEKYNLFDKILSLLSIDSTRLKLNIIKLVTNWLKFGQTINNINFQLIVPLINYNDPVLQEATIACIEQCLVSNGNTLQYFLDLGLLERAMLCIQKDSFKARIACISIFDTIIILRPEIAAVYLEQKLIPILLELISEIHSGFTLAKAFHIMQKMVNFVIIRIGQKDVYQELLNQFEYSNYEDVFEEFLQRSQSYKDRFTNKSVITESFESVMYDLNRIEENLERM